MIPYLCELLAASLRNRPKCEKRKLYRLRESHCTTGIIERGLRSRESITHSAAPRALSSLDRKPRSIIPVVHSHGALTGTYNTLPYTSSDMICAVRCIIHHVGNFIFTGVTIVMQMKNKMSHLSMIQLHAPVSSLVLTCMSLDQTSRYLLMALWFPRANTSTSGLTPSCKNCNDLSTFSHPFPVTSSST